MKQDHDRDIRQLIRQAPVGWGRFRWFGPGLLWMVASVGSGSVLFTPRVSSRYGYAFLWVVLVNSFLMWVAIREIGRYTTVSGKTILDGWRDVPGPRGWAIWLIFLPGLVSGIIVVAGISGLIGSALMIGLPGSQVFYALTVLFLSAILVVTGKYRKVEHVTSIMALILVTSVAITAVVVGPDISEIAAGLVPSLGEDFDPFFILPWIGFLLAGSAGTMWYSYWVAARGFGGPLEVATVGDENVEAGDQEKLKESERMDPGTREHWMKSWIVSMGITAGIGIVGGTLVNLAFLILGAELLRPEGIIPEGIRVASDLAQLLAQVWGRTGFWLLITGITVALWGTVIANQDGWGRMYTDATFILRQLYTRRNGRGDGMEERAGRRGYLDRIWNDRPSQRNAYIIVVLTLVPAALFLAVRDPVKILSAGGIITAIHMPVVILLTLFMNRTRLPREYQPNKLWSALMWFFGLFFVFFAAFYFYDLIFISD